jgi:DNA polymerase III delta prime subunit
MIKKATDLNFTNKKLKVLIAGYPGIGKTTLALSAPAPLLLDLDKGVDLVEAKFRGATSVVTSFDELMEDLKNADLEEIQTIVVDTGGKLLELLKPKVIAEDPKNGQRDGALTLKGYGAVSRSFSNFMNFLDTLNKHVVILFHAKEERDGDSVKLRILVEGSTKDVIWQSMDLGGFIEMRGKQRVIGFSNCERYFAKATHSIKGTYEIPDTGEVGKNTFLTDMFKKAIDDLNSEVKQYANQKQIYDQAMYAGRKLINEAEDLQTFNAIIKDIQNLTHILTSKEELRHLLTTKAQQLNFVWSKESNAYVAGHNVAVK